MRSRSAAYCCQRMTDALSYVYSKFGFEDVNYLDDLGAAEEDDKAEEAYDCLGYVLATIGVEESENKASPPNCIATFLGILYNMIDMTMTIKLERLLEIREMLQSWLNKKSATLNELQMLLGKLNFTCSTIRAGRIFIARLINEITGFPSCGKRRLSTEIKKDLEWWLNFMETFDRVSIIPLQNWSAPDIEFATDACLKVAGGWANGEFFREVFPEWMLNNVQINIHELELTALITGLKLWSARYKNKNFLIHCDNQVTVEVVNSGRARNKFTHACLREICFTTAKNNAQIKVVYLEGISNRIPDCLSRWDKGQIYRDQFRELTQGWRTM